MSSPPTSPGPPASHPSPYAPEPSRPDRTRLWVIIGVISAVVVAAAIAAVIIGARQLGSSIATDNAPHKYSSTDGYTVVFPGKPRVNVGTDPSLHQAEVVRGTTTYLVESETFGTTTSAANVNSVLTGALNGGAKALGGKPTSGVVVTTLDGEPAESQTFSSTAGELYVLASLHDGDKFVGIIAINPSESELKKLVASFQFTP